MLNDETLIYDSLLIENERLVVVIQQLLNDEFKDIDLDDFESFSKQLDSTINEIKENKKRSVELLKTGKVEL